MDHLFSVCFSNRVEELFTGFSEQLFASSHPLTKRLVVVPSAAMKSWLMLRMASDAQLGIAAGVEMGFIEPSVKRLLNLMSGNPQNQTDYFEPSEVELALALEVAINEVISSYSKLPLERQLSWRPLVEYLGTKSRASRRGSKRAGALATTLAKLFIEYGKYGGKWLATWKNEDWQSLLWQRMESQFQCWNYPYRKLETAVFESRLAASDLQVHVFGLSYLAPLYHRFFLKLSHQIPVNYYVLSPCQKFWSDLLSDKEGVRLKKYWHGKQASEGQQGLLEEYLRDTNPLLANFGRLGREMAMQLESGDPLLEERYALPETILTQPVYEELAVPEIRMQDSEGPLSILEAIQADVALLRNPDKAQKIHFSDYDGSVQVHAAPKPMREVQVIYDAIMQIIHKHQQDSEPILPGEIVVMASNLALYEPYVRSVFESSESVLDIQLMDVQMPSHNPYIKAFLHLIRMPLGRWDIGSMMELFEFPAFQGRHRIKKEELHQIWKWLKDAGISWGRDSHHRNELLKRDHCEKEAIEHNEIGTWEEGLGRLLEGLAMTGQVGFSHENCLFNPLEKIEGHQGELLGTVLRLIRSLLADLKPLYDDTKFTLSEWAAYLRCLSDAYLIPTAEEDGNEGYRVLFEQINAFARMNNLKLSKEGFAFHSIRRHLEEALHSRTTIYRESNLQSVRFCSLLPMRAVPAKVVILMGMGDGEFPRREEALSLNLLKSNAEADYVPSQMDFDRYLFLEAMLSARKYFIMSYVSQSPGSSQQKLPSLLVSELLSYIEQAYATGMIPISQACLFNHSLFSYDKDYFSADNRFKSYSKCGFRAAMARYHPEKIPAHSFIPVFTKLPEVPLSNKDVVVLADLMAFSKSPLRVYFNKALDIYIENEEDRQIRKDEDFVLSRPATALILKTSAKHTIETMLRRAMNEGQLPGGPFREAEKARLKKDIEKLKENLLLLGITIEKIFDIEFSERYASPLQTETGWRLPPLEVFVPDMGIVRIVGHIETVSNEGLIAIAEDDVKEAIKIWPMWLVFCCLVQAHELPIDRKLIFAKGEKWSVKEEEFESPEKLLIHFLNYYFKGLQNPSPLMPECISPMLRGAVEKVSDIFQTTDDESFNQTYDAYLKWIKRTSPLTDMHASMANWQSTAKTLFVDMHQAWYPKSIKEVDV